MPIKKPNIANQFMDFFKDRRTLDQMNDSDCKEEEMLETYPAVADND